MTVQGLCRIRPWKHRNFYLAALLTRDANKQCESIAYFILFVMALFIFCYTFPHTKGKRTNPRMRDFNYTNKNKFVKTNFRKEGSFKEGEKCNSVYFVFVFQRT